MNIGVVGCGEVVTSLHLPVLAGVPEVSVRWVCDSSPDRARTVAKDWHIKRAFSRLEECEEVDAVLIATPVGTRKAILEHTAARGWHALCEKPFARTADEHQEFLELAVRNNLIFTCGYMRRYYWAVEEARKLTAARFLGSLRGITAGENAHLERTGLDLSSYRNSAQASGGGVLLETGCHIIDALMYIAGASGVAVRACAQEIWDGYELETVASADLLLSTGEVVALQFTVSGIRACLDGIVLQFDGGEMTLQNTPAKGVLIRMNTSPSAQLNLPHPHNWEHLQLVSAAFRREWLHFLEAVNRPGEWDLRRETGYLASDFITQCGRVANPTRSEVVSCAL